MKYLLFILLLIGCSKNESAISDFKKGKKEYLAGNFIEAEKFFVKSLKDSSCEYREKYWLSKARSQISGKESEALETINSRTEDFPYSPESEYLKGNLLEKSRMLEGAILSYKSILQTESILALTCLRLARIYKNTGLKEKSIYYLNKGLMYSGENPKLSKLIKSEIEKQEK